MRLFIIYLHVSFISLIISKVECTTAANCISAEISDLMGDYWTNAIFTVSSTTNGKAIPDQKYSVNDDLNPRVVNICVDDNYESTVKLSVTSIDPSDIVECPWEIMWIVKANDGRVFQAGTFNTTMSFIYAPHSWNLVSANNLMRTSFSCAAQIGSVAQSCSSTISSVVVINPSIVAIASDNQGTPDAQNLGSGAAEVQLQTYDTLSQGWFLSNGKGSVWYITDESRTVSLVVGSMASGVSMQRTALLIPGGSYYLRVTGALDDYAKDHYWYFCGVYGSAGDELSFFIENGECLASQHYSAATLRSGRIQTTLQIHGSMAVSGVTKDVKIDTTALSELKGILIDGAGCEYLPRSTLDITAFSFSKGRKRRVLSKSKTRKLSNEILAVQFLISLVLEDLGIDGTNKYKLSTVADSMLSNIHSYIDCGDYFRALQKRGYDSNSDFLLALTGITMNELRITEVAYTLLAVRPTFGDAAAASSFTSAQSYAANLVLDYMITCGFILICTLTLFVMLWFIAFANSQRSLDDSDDENSDESDSKASISDGSSSTSSSISLGNNGKKQDNASDNFEHRISSGVGSTLASIGMGALIEAGHGLGIGSTSGTGPDAAGITSVSKESKQVLPPDAPGISGLSQGIPRQISRSGHLAISMPLPKRS